MSLEDLSYEQRDELAALSQTLANDPKTRKEFLRLTKTVRPNLPIPELEIEDKTNMAMEQANQRVAQLEAKLHEKDVLANLQSRRNALKEKGYARTDEDIERIEKVMLEKNIANHETAAEYDQWMQQAAKPTPVGYTSSPLKQFDLSRFKQNPVQAAREEASKALGEIRNSGPFGFNRG